MPYHEHSEGPEDLNSTSVLFAAYEARLSAMNARLIATLDALDALQKSREQEMLKHNHDQERIRVLKSQMKDVVDERDDMRDAVEELVEKVEQMNDCSFLSQPGVSISRLIGPAEVNDEDLSLDAQPPEQDRMAYAPAIAQALSLQLTQEREAHKQTKKEAAAQIAVLRAQVARRDAELEEHILLTTPEDLPPQTVRFIPRQSQGVLDQAEVRNQQLELEVDRLAKKLSRAQAAAALKSQTALGTMPPPPENAPGAAKAAINDLDRQIQEITGDVNGLRAERLVLSNLKDPPDGPQTSIDSVLLIEEECLRLQASEKSLKRELEARQNEAEERESELLKRIKELEDEKALGATPRPFSPHPLPPYASNHDDVDEPVAGPSTWAPPPKQAAPRTPPRIQHALPSPPSSTHNRNKRPGLEETQRELRAMLGQLQEKDRVLGELRRELEDLRAKMLSEED